MKKCITVVVTLILFLGLFAGNSSGQEQKPVGEVFSLGDVLVTEKNGNAELATTVTTITAEQLKESGAKNLADALDSVPGIDVQTGTKGHASLKLRGFDQEDVKVLIDGVPAHGTYFGSLDLDKIPVDAIARIDITKGASSVLYGPNAMGGVINVITKKGGKEPITSLTTSFGQNNQKNLIANHGGSAGNFNYWLTGSYRKSDEFELSDDFDPANNRTGINSEYHEDGGARDLSYYTDKTLNAKIGIEQDANTQVYLSFDYHDNEKGCPTEADRYWAYSEWKQWHLNLVGEHDVTDILTLKARAYYVKHDDTLTDVSWDAKHTTKKKWFEKSSYDDYTMGGEAQAYLDLGPWSQLKLGVNYLKDNHKQQDFLDDKCLDVISGIALPGFATEEEYEADTYSVALEDEIIAMEKLSVIVGASFDTYEPRKTFDRPKPDSMNSFNPQAGLVYDATDSLALHASVGKKTRFPQLSELYSDKAGGNPNLNPQETIAYEVGVSKTITPTLSMSAALFYNDVTDRITQVKVNGDKFYKNIGKSTLKGLELATHYTTPCNATIDMNYTWLDAEDKDENGTRDSEQTPKHKFNLDLGYAFKMGLSAHVQATYTADQIEYDKNYNPIDLDNFWLLNAKLIQKLNFVTKLDMEAFLEFKNIMDKDYEEGSGPMPGRSFLAGVTLTF
ncbi:MAG: TonB-dependent receptor [Pseudomonadota bacterium]